MLILFIIRNILFSTFIKRFSRASMCIISFYDHTCRNSFEAEEEPLRQALMYYTMSVYGCFQSAHFPSIIIGQHTLWHVFTTSSPSLGKIHSMYSMEVRPLNLRLCTYFLYPYRYYIYQGKAWMWQQPNARVSIRAIRALVRRYR